MGAQHMRLALFLPRRFGRVAANQNGDASADAGPASQAFVKIRGPKQDVQQLGALQISRWLRGTSDVGRFAHALLQTASGRFVVIFVKIRLANPRGDRLQMPVGGGQKVRATHAMIVERSHGGFGTPVSGAFRGHLSHSERSRPKGNPAIEYSKETGIRSSRRRAFANELRRARRSCSRRTRSPPVRAWRPRLRRREEGPLH